MFSSRRDEEEKVRAETQSARLPTLVFLNQHENPDLQNFYNEILPVLKKCGYTKFLSESFPNKRLGTEYFDTELATCLKEQNKIQTALQKSGKLEAYNALPTAAARLGFCLEHQVPYPLAQQCANMPRDISLLAFSKEVISKFGFHFFGTEDAGVKEFLREEHGSLTDEFAISTRDALNASELIKHHNLIQEGGVLMSLGLAHFSGVRKHLIKDVKQSNDYMFIYLTNDFDAPHPWPASIIAESDKYKTFKLIQVRLDSSEEGRPDVAARNVLLLPELLPHNIQAPPMLTGTGRTTALRLATILDNKPDIKMDRETAFHLTNFSNDATKVQALARGRLTRKKVSPLLHQFKQAQIALQAAESQERALRERIIAAANHKRYETIIGLAEKAMACQETNHTTKSQIQALKQTAKNLIKP